MQQDEKKLKKNEKLSKDVVAETEASLVENAVSEDNDISENDIISENDAIPENDAVSEDKAALPVSENRKVRKEKSAEQIEKDRKTKERERGVKAQKRASKFVRFLKRRKGLLIFLVIVLLLFLGYKYVNRKSQEALAALTTPTQEVDSVQKMDLSSRIATTGTIISPETRTLTSVLNGKTITAVNAEVGDKVYAGDILVTFSTDDINRSIKELEEDIVKSAQRDTIDSQDYSRDYVYSYGTQAYNLSKAAERVDQALKDLYNACDGYGDARRAKEKYLNEGGADQMTIDNLDAQISAAYVKEEAAQTAYDSAVAEQAEALRNATNSMSMADSTFQKNTLNAGSSTEDLQRKLEEYQDSLADYVVTSPIDGIVTAVNVQAENGFAGGQLMTIQNVDSYVVTTEIDEYDIPDVQVGQQVIIKTDATRDDELAGTVSFVSPTATVAQGSNATTYQVKIDIDTMDNRIKLGMSAKLNIITEQHFGVLAVRYDALGEDQDGNPVIYIRDESAVDATAPQADGRGESISVVSVDGQQVGGKKPKKDATVDPLTQKIPTKEVPVRIGVVGDYYTEVISPDIYDGMEIIVPESEKTKSPLEQLMESLGGPVR